MSDTTLSTQHMADLVALRHDLHRHPELLYETHRTAGIVARRLRAAGCDEVVEGIGRTGVVATIRGRRGDSGRSIALRADMDALPIEEQTNLDYASATPGRMHACGHDGHTTMLMGAAEVLARSRDFDGTVVLIFQPAEEGGAGAKAMLDDGLLQRFPADEMYALHNRPGLPVGHFAATTGPAMGSVDEVRIRVQGTGGHAAYPHQTVDPVVIAAELILAAQSVAARNMDPLSSAVVSLTTVHGGDAFNVIPAAVELGGTVRTLDEDVRDRVEARLAALVEHIASAHGAEGHLEYIRHYPVTNNHARETEFALAAAAAYGGAEQVDGGIPATMGGEDFAFFLQERPGAIIWSGNGDSKGLHHPAYNFNDEGLAPGIAYFLNIVRHRLA